MGTKERKLRLRRETSRANENEEQKEARTSLAQLMLHEHFLEVSPFLLLFTLMQGLLIYQLLYSMQYVPQF